MPSDPTPDDRPSLPDETASSGPPGGADPLPPATPSDGAVDPPPLTMPGPPRADDGAADLRFTTARTPAEDMAAGAPPPPPVPRQPAATDPGPVQLGTMRPSPAVSPGEGGAPSPDELDRVCPYLLSEDGTWRSTQPDPGHRCMAQEPPGELPPMFQERFCLSERHVRCEWYKAAQGMGRSGAAASSTGVASEAGVALAQTAATTRSTRPVIVAIALVGGLLLLVVIALLLGGEDDGRGGVGFDEGPDPSVVAVETAAPDPTPAATATPGVVVTAAPTESPAGPETLIRYRVQADEKLIKIGDKFGIDRRQQIIRANPGMEDDEPFVETGQLIIVPVPATMSREEISQVEGFVEFVEEDPG